MSKICKNGIIRDGTAQEEADLVAHREQNAIYDAAKEAARAAAPSGRARRLDMRPGGAGGDAPQVRPGLVAGPGQCSCWRGGF